MRLKVLATIARLLGLHFHIDGIPFGVRLFPVEGVSGSTHA